jgi:hypothetical protein
MPDTIFHTDRGSEYTSSACVDACQQLGLRRSMSRTGSCLDNAVAESWFASLKVELVDRAHYRTRAEARTAIFRWIAWYNRFRLHSTRGYLPPIEWEQQHATIDHGRIAPVSASRTLLANLRVVGLGDLLWSKLHSGAQQPPEAVNDDDVATVQLCDPGRHSAGRAGGVPEGMPGDPDP